MPLRPSGRGRWPANPPRPSAPASPRRTVAVRARMSSWGRGLWRCTAWEAGLPRRLPRETRTFSQWSASLESGAAAAEPSSSSGGWGARQLTPRPRPAHASPMPRPRLACASRTPCRASRAVRATKQAHRSRRVVRQVRRLARLVGAGGQRLRRPRCRVPQGARDATLRAHASQPSCQQRRCVSQGAQGAIWRRRARARAKAAAARRREQSRG